MARELWQLQRDFNERFWASKGGWPGPEKLTETTKDFALHLIKEVTEVFDELSWKMHRAPKGPVDKDNVLEELIDCQKFLWGLMQVWGFTYEDFEHEFKRKSMVVEQRFQQEQDFTKLRVLPCAIVDIDGVLADYPRCFFQWLEANSKPWLSTGLYGYALAQAWAGLPLIEKESAKRAYRQSGAKASLPVLAGAKELLLLLQERKLKAVLLTNRPYGEHYRIYPDTLEWLKKNDLPYDGIFWAQDKGLEAIKHFANICWAIDDSPKNIARLTEAGVPTCLVSPMDTELDTAAFVEVAKKLPKIERAAIAWQQHCSELKARRG